MNTNLHQHNRISSYDQDKTPMSSRRMPHDDPTMAVEHP